ncbi:MAG: hypothetical protein ABTR27_11220 [Candidatus Competibacter phosphatis]
MKKREIVQYAETLFAHTDAYNFPALFANRNDSRAFVVDRVQANDPRVIVVSDILGSGKTFLVNMVVNALGQKNNRPLICGRIRPGDLGTSPFAMIDEWDIKANPKRFRQTLDLVKEAHAKGGTTLILLGDFTLKSAGFRQAMGGGAALAYVPMEPLNPAFFNLAMRQRVHRIRGNLSEDQPDADRDRFIALELEAALVPDWTVTSANFRDVLKALLQMAGHLEPVDQEGMIGEREAKAWLNEHAPQGMSEAQRRFYQEFVVYLRGIVHDGGGWPAIQPMAEGTLKSDLGFGDLSDEAFRLEVVEPLARSPGLVSAMGTPEVSEDGSYYDRFPGPYLPGTYTRLRIGFGA